ncbi:hypothetical protein AB5I41_08725 [Sphingomonas sp. MMS24-JH45]
MMATAGRVTVAEVEEIVPAGALDADAIHRRYLCRPGGAGDARRDASRS